MAAPVNQVRASSASSVQPSCVPYAEENRMDGAAMIRVMIGSCHLSYSVHVSVTADARLARPSTDTILVPWGYDTCHMLSPTRRLEPNPSDGVEPIVEALASTMMSPGSVTVSLRQPLSRWCRWRFSCSACSRSGSSPADRCFQTPSTTCARRPS